MEKQHKFSIWYVLLGIWVVLLIQNVLSSYLAIKTIPYSEFLELLKQRRVSEVAISANQIQGKMLVDNRDPNKTELFKTVRVDPDLSGLLEQYNITFKGELESTFLRNLFSWVFPLLLFIGIWYFLMKRMTGGQAGFMTLGKNKAKIYMENELNVTFADAAGVDVSLYKYVHIVLGGGICGLGGGYIALVTCGGSWTYNAVAGQGWIALALVIFAAWSPYKAILGSLVFGALSVLRLYIPNSVISMPGAVFAMVPFVTTCIVLVVSSIKMRRENQQPRSCGINYFREER